MPGKTVNYDDWKDYDNRKQREKKDPEIFRCEGWEVRYLHSKIRKLYPSMNADLIRETITTCCASIPGPLHREKFVQNVMQELAKMK